jgi:tRNA dimethylallyltransferase
VRKAQVGRLAIVGSTASGKSAVALEVARTLRTSGTDAQIFCIDAMTVYRGMNIGTAKATQSEQAEVPHHLLDLFDPSEESSLARFVDAATPALAAAAEEGVTPILVGGTGLYFDAVVDGLELPGVWPEIRSELEAALAAGETSAPALHGRLAVLDPLAASRIEPTNDRRTIRALEVTLGSGRPFSSFGPGLQAARLAGPANDETVVVGIDRSRPVLAERIAGRYAQQRSDGFVQEAIDLRNAYGESLSRTARQALGYREIWAALAELEPKDASTVSTVPNDAFGTAIETALDSAFATAIARTFTFAKRQQRWFRRDPRIHWLNADMHSTKELAAICCAYLEHSDL